MTPYQQVLSKHDYERCDDIDEISIITKGGDAGKSVAHLRDEVFNPNVSDLEYFQSRLKHLANRPTPPPPARQETR